MEHSPFTCALRAGPPTGPSLLGVPHRLEQPLSCMYITPPHRPSMGVLCDRSMTLTCAKSALQQELFNTYPNALPHSGMILANRLGIADGVKFECPTSVDGYASLSAVNDVVRSRGIRDGSSLPIPDIWYLREEEGSDRKATAKDPINIGLGTSALHAALDIGNPASRRAWSIAHARRRVMYLLSALKIDGDRSHLIAAVAPVGDSVMACIAWPQSRCTASSVSTY
jgi:hypothetical protein